MLTGRLVYERSNMVHPFRIIERTSDDSIRMVFVCHWIVINAIDFLQDSTNDMFHGLIRAIAAPHTSYLRHLQVTSDDDIFVYLESLDHKQIIVLLRRKFRTWCVTTLPPRVPNEHEFGMQLEDLTGLLYDSSFKEPLIMVSEVFPKNITVTEDRSDLVLKLDIPVGFLLDDEIIDGVFRVGALCQSLNLFDARVYSVHAQLGIRFVYMLSEWYVEPLCLCKERPTPLNIYTAWIELVKQLHVLVDRLLDDHAIQLMI